MVSSALLAWDPAVAFVSVISVVEESKFIESTPRSCVRVSKKVCEGIRDILEPPGMPTFTRVDVLVTAQALVTTLRLVFGHREGSPAALETLYCTTLISAADTSRFGFSPRAEALSAFVSVLSSAIYTFMRNSRWSRNSFISSRR